MEVFVERESCALEGCVIASRRLDRLAPVEVGRGRERQEKEGREQPINVAGVFLEVSVVSLNLVGEAASATQCSKEAREGPLI